MAEKEKDEPPEAEELAHRILLEVFCRCSSFLSHIGLLPCCISLPLDPANDAEEIANLGRLQELVERNRHWIILSGRNPGEKSELKFMKESPAYVQKFRERFAENLTDSNLEGFFIYFYPENSTSGAALQQQQQQQSHSGAATEAAGGGAAGGNRNLLRWVAGALVEYIDDGDAVLSFAFSPRSLSGTSEMELLLVTMSYAYLVFVRSMPYELPTRRRIPWKTPKLVGADALYAQLPPALKGLDETQTLPPPVGKINLSCRLTLDEQDLEICPRRLWDLMNTHFMQTGNHLEPNDAVDEGHDETLHSDQLDATKCSCHQSSNIKQVYFFQSRDMIFRVFGALVSQKMKANRRKAKELDFFPHLPSEQLVTELESLQTGRTAEEKELWDLMEILPPKTSERPVEWQNGAEAAAVGRNNSAPPPPPLGEEGGKDGSSNRTVGAGGGGGGDAGGAGGVVVKAERRTEEAGADGSTEESGCSDGKENNHTGTDQKGTGVRKKLDGGVGRGGTSSGAEGEKNSVGGGDGGDDDETSSAAVAEDQKDGNNDGNNNKIAVGCTKTEVESITFNGENEGEKAVAAGRPVGDEMNGGGSSNSSGEKEDSKAAIETPESTVASVSRKRVSHTMEASPTPSHKAARGRRSVAAT